METEPHIPITNGLKDKTQRKLENISRQMTMETQTQGMQRKQTVRETHGDMGYTADI